MPRKGPGSTPTPSAGGCACKAHDTGCYSVGLARGGFDSYTLRVIPPRMRLEADLRPHQTSPRLLRGDVCFCPLCGFLLVNNWDGHFLPCLLSHLVEVCYG